MMSRQQPQRGVTLIELLVSIAILSLVMAGIYGLLAAAYKSYSNTRSRIEAQQSARTVLDYLVYRLREVEGGNRPETPWNCTEQCHRVMSVSDPAAAERVPCERNVTSPRRTLYLTVGNTYADEDGNTVNNLDQLADLTQRREIPDAYAKSNLRGTVMEFRADMLPLTGFSETFTDSPRGKPLRNGVWDWTAGDKTGGDVNENAVYDPGETELLEDMNENSTWDSFTETWGLRLRNSSTDNHYELVESLSFDSLSDPAYNRSIYPDEGYTFADNIVIADGIVGFRVEIVKMVDDTNATALAAYAPATTRPDNQCAGAACHGATTGVNPYEASIPTTQIYLNNGDAAGDFSMALWLNTHWWWNVKGVRVEVTTAATKVRETRFVTLAEFVIPRNIEVNIIK